MDKKFSISLTLTIGVFALAVVLFAFVVIALNDVRSDPASATAISSAPCTPCHRMHQKLIGPPLAGVLERRDSTAASARSIKSGGLMASHLLAK